MVEPLRPRCEASALSAMEPWESGAPPGAERPTSEKGRPMITAPLAARVLMNFLRFTLVQFAPHAVRARIGPRATGIPGLGRRLRPETVRSIARGILTTIYGRRSNGFPGKPKENVHARWTAVGSSLEFGDRQRGLLMIQRIATTAHAKAAMSIPQRFWSRAWILAPVFALALIAVDRPRPAAAGRIRLELHHTGGAGRRTARRADTPRAGDG